VKLVLLCATQRGLAVLKKLTELLPTCELAVVSFREESCEPPFFEAVREFSLAHNGSFFEARRIESEDMAELWQGTSIDLILAVSWRYLIPVTIYKRARLGTYVFHDSLLPAYRGFSPTVWAMINGETETGVTLFEINERMDGGAIIAQVRVPIDLEDSITTVVDRVTQAYLLLLESQLTTLIAGCATRRPQNESQASYTCRRLPDDNEIDWHAQTKTIYNLIRAVTTPYPGAFTWLEGKRLTIWKAQLPSSRRNYVGRVPGRVVEISPGKGVLVLTGDGSLLLEQVQLEGGQTVCSAELIRSLSTTLNG
jgi:methionyl-tRNA formyltransferase